MADRFPIRIWPPGTHRWYPQAAAITGGQPISGAQQTADLSTGGSWVCEYSATLRTRQQWSAWRAFLVTLNAGVGLVEVPVLDMLQPWPGGVIPQPQPHSDLTPFDDLSLYDTQPISAVLAANAYMPAWPAPATPPTQAQIQILAGAALQGGEWFSVTGPNGEVRLHMIGRIMSVVGDVSTVSFIPPLREDLAAGTLVDFNEPRCTMKADIGSIADAWPEVTPPFYGRPTIRFLEASDVT